MPDVEERRPKRELKQVERIQSSMLTKSKRKLASKGGRHAMIETASKAQRQENSPGDSALSALGKLEAEESGEEKSDAKVENEEEGSDEYEPSHGSSVTDESDDDFEPVPPAMPASQRRGKRGSTSKTRCGHVDALARSVSCSSQHDKTVWKGASTGTAAPSEIIDLRDAAGGVGGADVATLTAGSGNSGKDKEPAGAKAGPAEQDSAILQEVDRLWQKECAYKRWLKERDAADADPKHSTELLEFLEKRRAAFFDSKLRREPDKIDGAAPEMTPSAEVRDCSASSLGARPVTSSDDGAPDATKAGPPPLSRSPDAGDADMPNLHLANMDELEREIARRKAAANLHLAKLQELEQEVLRRKAEEAKKSPRLGRRGTSFPTHANPSSAEKKEEGVGREGKQDENLVASHEDLPADLEAFESKQQLQGLEGTKRSERELGLAKADECPRIHAFDRKEERKQVEVNMPSSASGAEGPQGSPPVTSQRAGGGRKQAAGAATSQSRGTVQPCNRGPLREAVTEASPSSEIEGLASSPETSSDIEAGAHTVLMRTEHCTESALQFSALSTQCKSNPSALSALSTQCSERV